MIMFLMEERDICRMDDLIHLDISVKEDTVCFILKDTFASYSIRLKDFTFEVVSLDPVQDKFPVILTGEWDHESKRIKMWDWKV
jgi:hypothetical protein